ncbi:fibronectin type III domain-containing protein [Leifsonia sp. NPDC077715]|uniref:fibronectin type III domain-containing protein n=1 Tax=Leifsonia sp. NPDC077715 TaxID=3155539 RepID=UPI003423575F
MRAHLRPFSLLIVAAVVGTGAATLGAGVAEAQAAASASVITDFDTTFLPGAPSGVHLFDDGGAAVLAAGSSATTSIRIDVPNPRAGESPYSVEIDAPADGTALHAGHYTGIRSYETHADLPIVELPYSGYAFAGDLDILDIADDATGRLTRFDIVVRDFNDPSPQITFGEFRMGEPEPTPLLLGTRNIEWPTTAVGSVPIVATEWLHNTSAAPVAVGALNIGGAAAADYRLSADTCSNRSLAVGAICSVGVGFSPKAGGPRNATLSIPTGSGTETASLAGTAPLGTNTMTTSSDNPTLPLTHSFTDTGIDDFVYLPQSPYTWQDFHVGEQVDGATGFRIFLWGPNGQIPTGTHPTLPIASSRDSTPYSNNVEVRGIGCDGAGTETVNAFRLNGDGSVNEADVSFAQLCDDGKTHFSGRFQWQVRSDVTQPAPVTGLSASGGRLSWAASASSDVATTVVRLMRTPDASSASPTSGYGVYAGTATSVALPALVAGERDTAVVYAIDKAGNVSAAASIPVVNGTPAPIITAPSAPTGVRVTPTDRGGLVSFTPPASTGGSPIIRYTVTAAALGGTDYFAYGTSSPIQISGLPTGVTYQVTVAATNGIAGRGPASSPPVALTSVAAPPPPPPPSTELLPDPGFESGLGGWRAFGTATAGSVATPVHSGAHAAQAVTTATTPVLAGITQNTVVPSTVAGTAYTARCWVRTSTAGVKVTGRFLEYVHDWSSDTHFPATSVTVTPGVWTLVSVTSTAVASGDRMVPQFYATNLTKSAGALTLDDCSVK